MKILRVSTDAYIQLSDPTTNDLFAECPVSLPLKTCIEGVIDSSRYFVLRVVDRESGRHAFIGLGFRDRNEASDFNAVLSEYQMDIERKEAAVARQKAFNDAYKSDNEREVDGKTTTESRRVAPETDSFLRPGEMLNLKIGSGLKCGSFGASKGKLTKSFSLMFDPENNGAAVAALAPPPIPLASRRKSSDLSENEPMGISPSFRGAMRNATPPVSEAAWGDFAGAEVEV